MHFSFSKVKEELLKEEFSQIQSAEDLKETTFLCDGHCGDVVLFPHHLMDYLESLSIVKEKALVIQVCRVEALSAEVQWCGDMS